MENELEQRNIIISDVSLKTWGLSISDEKGLKYNVPKFKKNTQELTMAYTVISSLKDNGIGLNKCFKFVTVPNNQGGQSRYVRIISEPEAEGEKSTYKSPAMQNTNKVKIEPPIDWDKRNAEKEDHIKWLNALNNATLLASTGKIELKDLKFTAQKIYTMTPLGVEDLPSTAQQGHVEELPVINQEEEELDPKNIPF